MPVFARTLITDPDSRAKEGVERIMVRIGPDYPGLFEVQFVLSECIGDI